MNQSKIIENKKVMMLFCIAITAATLNQYAKLIQDLLTIKYDWKFELFMVLGQLVFQFPFILKQSIEQKWEYYYNMLVVSALGSITLLPLIVFNHLYLLPTIINVIYFLIVVMFMFLDHKRRVSNLNLSAYISYTWVLYRFLILIFILL
ncbi:hypothetical protein BH10BAC1_BH10BAC1_10660 [soil metagenome]